MNFQRGGKNNEKSRQKKISNIEKGEIRENTAELIFTLIMAENFQ